LHLTAIAADKIAKYLRPTWSSSCSWAIECWCSEFSDIESLELWATYDWQVRYAQISNPLAS